MKLNLKFNATKVDEIEQVKKLPIENCIGDTSISSLVLFLQKGLVDDNGVWGVTKAIAMDTIDKFLEEDDKDELVFQIIEALINGGFLSRELNMDQIRKANKKQQEKVQQLLGEV